MATKAIILKINLEPALIESSLNTPVPLNQPRWFRLCYQFDAKIPFILKSKMVASNILKN